MSKDSSRYLVSYKSSDTVPGLYPAYTLKLVHTRSFWTREEAKLALFEYMEVFYNHRRRHSSLGYVSPAEYERTAEVQRQAA